MLNDKSIVELEELYDKIKIVLGQKISEARQLAGYAKKFYEGGSKSGNLLFKTESGSNLPNNDTLEYYIKLYQITPKGAENLRELHRQAKEVKKTIIRKKRGWN